MGLIQSISNTFGLILLTSLLGNGIVAFPKFLWHKGNYMRSLSFFEFDANNKNENMDEAIEDLKNELGVRFY